MLEPPPELERGSRDRATEIRQTQMRALAGLAPAPGSIMEGVTDPELLQRARNAGIATEYYDWRGQYVAVPAETLAAILDVLEQAPEPAESDPDEADSNGLVPPRLTIPAKRQWGFTVQLYSLRSKESWGHGDLHDLA